MIDPRRGEHFHSDGKLHMPTERARFCHQCYPLKGETGTERLERVAQGLRRGIYGPVR